jgi:hypothetical protein
VHQGCSIFAIAETLGVQKLNIFLNCLSLLFISGHINFQLRRIILETAFEKARNGLELNGKFAYGAMPAPIADSWRRCIRLGLDPSSKPEESVVSHRPAPAP